MPIGLIIRLNLQEQPRVKRCSNDANIIIWVKIKWVSFEWSLTSGGRPSPKAESEMCLKARSKASDLTNQKQWSRDSLIKQDAIPLTRTLPSTRENRSTTKILTNIGIAFIALTHNSCLSWHHWELSKNLRKGNRKSIQVKHQGSHSISFRSWQTHCQSEN